jgi:hypothetical protein
MIARKNVTLVYHKESGEPRMLVIDAHDLTDPSWNPEGHAHINIPIENYNKHDHETVSQHIANVLAENKS